MKKIKVIEIIGTILFVIYVALVISEIIFGVMGDYRELIFSIILAVISMNMLFKGVFLKSQSTLWFAITLVLYAILMIIFSVFNIDYNLYNYIYVLLPIIASTINIVVFHNLLYIKVIILNITLVIAFVISKFTNFHDYLYFVIGGISVVVGIILCRFLKMGREKV